MLPGINTLTGHVSQTESPDNPILHMNRDKDKETNESSPMLFGTSLVHTIFSSGFLGV